jgi:hypothetical protein
MPLGKRWKAPGRRIGRHQEDGSEGTRKMDQKAPGRQRKGVYKMGQFFKMYIFVTVFNIVSWANIGTW